MRRRRRIINDPTEKAYGGLDLPRRHMSHTLEG